MKGIEERIKEMEEKMRGTNDEGKKKWIKTIKRVKEFLERDKTGIRDNEVGGEKQ